MYLFRISLLTVYSTYSCNLSILTLSLDILLWDASRIAILCTVFAHQKIVSVEFKLIFSYTEGLAGKVVRQSVSVAEPRLFWSAFAISRSRLLLLRLSAFASEAS